MDARVVTVKFNECINNRDSVGLAELMAEDHTFIDSAGCAIRGKANCLEAWRAFFSSFPDYRNVFDSFAVEADAVVVVGHSTCSDSRLNGRALWFARTRGDKLAEWRVYEDTPTNRLALGLSACDPRADNPITR